jgi:hypothetical protein
LERDVSASRIGRSYFIEMGDTILFSGFPPARAIRYNRHDRREGGRPVKRPLVFLSLTALLSALSAAQAFAQGSYLKKGQYGFGLTGAYAANSGAAGFSGAAGVGLGGIFDLSFGAGRAAYKAGATEFADLEAASFGPELRAHVIKQNSSRSPLSLALSIGYVRDNFSSPDLDAAGLDMWAYSLVVGGTVYRDVRLSGRAYLQPYAGLGYTNTSLKLRDLTGVTLSNENNLASFSAGLPFVYVLSERTFLIVQLELTFDKDATTFAVSAGLVVAFPTR